MIFIEYEGGIYKMYIFNRVTVIPQLPERIEKLSEIALWAELN